MGATIWLLGCILAPAQPPAPPPRPRGPEHAIATRLERGLELVYRGTFREQSSSAGVKHQRSYRVEARFLVLDATAAGADIAALTLVQDRSSISSRPGVKEERAPASARLERLKADPLCKLSGAGRTLVPIDGPPTLEVGPLVQVPSARVRGGQGWEVREEGRPAIAWMAATPVEMIDGRNCAKLTAVQQSDEWERPRADRGAWRRLETVWFDLRNGVVFRVERVIEQREAARREVSQSSTLRLDLESNARQPAYLTDAARVEIGKALAFREQAAPLVPFPSTRSRELATLQRAVARYMETYPATPYREAVAGVKRQIDAACKGEAVTVHHAEPVKPAVAAVGTEAPDFLASEITGTGTARLSRWKGRPILMVFYHPGSYTAADLLKFAGSVHTALGKHVAVVGMSVSDDAVAVTRQLNVMKLTIPVLYAGGLRTSYAVEATPKIMIIDSAGIVRGAYLGWGAETAGEVMAELRRWLGGR